MLQTAPDVDALVVPLKDAAYAAQQRPVLDAAKSGESEASGGQRAHHSIACRDELVVFQVTRKTLERDKVFAGTEEPR
jgi:hypothetical protein